MEIRIDSAGRSAPALHVIAERRARFVFRRLHWLVPRARVQLGDVNGPRGGLDKRCRVYLDVPGGAPVVVTSVARDWRTALDFALDRAARALLRATRRRAERSRRGAPLLSH